MKWKIVLLLLAFSLAANGAALFASLRPRPSGGCTGMSATVANPAELGLSPEQAEAFQRIDRDFAGFRGEIQTRLHALRAQLLECILMEEAAAVSCEEQLLAMSAEQLSLQRRLSQDLRQKLLLLSPEQRALYRQTVRQLTGVGGCGCMACTGSCH